MNSRQLEIPFLLSTHFEQVSPVPLAGAKGWEAWMNWLATGPLIEAEKWMFSEAFLFYNTHLVESFESGSIMPVH